MSPDPSTRPDPAVSAAGRTRTRGTTNANSRGSSSARRARRAWLLVTYAANVPGFARCYRCGDLLFNPDDHSLGTRYVEVRGELASVLTIDRIVPGCRGGTYRRDNIRPACGDCNSETGGSERGKRRNR